MPNTSRETNSATLALAGLLVASSALAQSPIAASAAARVDADSAASAPSGKRDPLAKWKPDPEQAAALAMLPADVASQHQELVRISKIPLPNYEERLKFEYLMGAIFPDKHPLRLNKEYLIDYYRSQGKPSQTELDELIASLKKRLIYLKGGSFMMGDFGPLVFKDKLTLTGRRENGPPHEVQLDGYSIMKGRVTFGEYDLYLRAKGKPLLAEGESIFPHRPGYVATGVKWAEADGYCQWLVQLTGKPFALTTEAQWEYGAREGGKLIAYPMYHLPGVKWQNKYQPMFSTSEKAIEKLVAQAGKENSLLAPYPPSLTGENRIGMQGVLGSGSLEWVADWYQDDYYSVSPKRNPHGPDQGTERVVRVGSNDLFNIILSRGKNPPETGQQFRCVLNEPKPWK
jgi:formylglycine-generating enzyme required for sulfatase activity